MLAKDEPSQGAAEAIVVLRLWASVLMEEVTVVSEVPTNILVSDL